MVSIMRIEFERLIRDVTLTTLAFAIALGWSLYQVAAGLAFFVTTLLQRFNPNDFNGGPAYGDLSWAVGHHVLAFGSLLRGLIELAVVLGTILLVRRKITPR
jgi:hypothetical protein